MPKLHYFWHYLEKVFLLMPLVLILLNFLSNKVFAVFLAEPISDIIAATVTVYYSIDNLMKFY